MYKALVLFDIDGTLLKGSTEHRNAFYEAYKRVYKKDIEKISKAKNSGRTDNQGKNDRSRTD